MDRLNMVQGEFDELVADNVSVHIERMDDGVLSIDVHRGTGTVVCGFIVANRRGLLLRPVLAVNLQPWGTLRGREEEQHGS